MTTLRIGVLTDRQLEVVDLVARGRPNKEVPARLGVTRRAVEALLTRIYEKLTVDNRAGLIAFVLSEAGVGLRGARRTAPGPTGGAADSGSLGGDTTAYVNVPFMVAVTYGPDTATRS
ncbi:MAG: helix-turn-helix transcriptional regulator [Chloroflexota bacterium]|nr:helix-turn-helix transcriptional regulator [Chloroflexota bacterium]